jgi:hypothetical protein
MLSAIPVLFSFQPQSIPHACLMELQHNGEKPYYWIRQDGNFGRSVSYGDQMPADLPEQRIKELKAQGYVSETKQADPNAARADALATMHSSIRN